MSGFQDIFQRIETKYLLNEDQYRMLQMRLKNIAKADEYGETQILNIYFDTPGYQLINTSLEKPAYKEKLRLRSYGIPKEETETFIEIKKKYGNMDFVLVNKFYNMEAFLKVFSLLLNLHKYKILLF